MDGFRRCEVSGFDGSSIGTSEYFSGSVFSFLFWRYNRNGIDNLPLRRGSGLAEERPEERSAFCPIFNCRNFFSNVLWQSNNPMVFKLFAKLKNNRKERSSGITLVEVAVTVFIISLFTLIIISDFPKIQRQFALSRVTYKLAQDLRKTQDLGLSGVSIDDKNGDEIAVKGYGVYINLLNSSVEYVVYADVNGDQEYNDDFSYLLCEQVDQSGDGSDLASDCVVEVVDVSKENLSLYIKSFENIYPAASVTSINFSPPNPTTTIDNLIAESLPPDDSRVGIILGLRTDDSAVRTVWANTSGLIEIQ